LNENYNKNNIHNLYNNDYSDFDNNFYKDNEIKKQRFGFIEDLNNNNHNKNVKEDFNNKDKYPYNYGDNNGMDYVGKRITLANKNSDNEKYFQRSLKNEGNLLFII